MIVTSPAQLKVSILHAVDDVNWNVVAPVTVAPVPTKAPTDTAKAPVSVMVPVNVQPPLFCVNVDPVHVPALSVPPETVVVVPPQFSVAVPPENVEVVPPFKSMPEPESVPEETVKLPVCVDAAPSVKVPPLTVMFVIPEKPFAFVPKFKPPEVTVIIPLETSVS